MAKSDLSSFDGLIGRVGDTVTYIRNGKVVRRKIGKSSKPASPKQKNSRTKMRVYNDFFVPIQEFIAVGYSAEAKRTKSHPNGLFSSYTLINSIKGTYPNQEIDHEQVLISKGNLPATPNVQAEVTEDGVKFSWDSTLTSKKFRNDDRVMVLVFFPESNSAEFDLIAAKRATGETYLQILKNETPTIMETYISFISNKSASNSIYTGRLLLPAAAKRNKKRKSK